MRQVVIPRHGAPEVLEVRESPDPEAGEGQVRVRVRAAGVNFSDLMARMGLYPDAPPLPCVVGYEVSGTLDQIGKGVTTFKEGDRVLAMPRFGGNTDTLVLPAVQTVKMPDRMTFEEGAALPVAYITAHHMMIFNHNLREGSRVLIHSAAGGVGMAAIQIAKTRKCVIFGTASPGKHDFLRDHGVHHPIDSTGNVAAQVRAAMGDKGIDLILDPIGGASWGEGYDLLAPCGHLSAFGFSAASPGKKRNLLGVGLEFWRVKKWSPTTLMGDNKTISGTNMLNLFEHLDILLPQFESLMGMYERKEIAPHVGKTFSFADAAKAHHYMHDRKVLGKVLLIP